MKLQIGCLCDAANLSSDGKVNLLGEFDTIWAPRVPHVHLLMYFVAKLRVLASDGSKMDFRFRVVADDGQIISPEIGLQIEGQHPGGGETAGLPIILPIANAMFPEHGTYTFELRCGGAVLAEVPLYVKEPARP